MIVKFYQLNQHDNLNLTVDKISNEVVYQNSKWLNDNELIWVKIYDDGHAKYGIEMQHDPLHGNEKYTWSSRPSVMNLVFDLVDTPYELSCDTIGLREENSKYYCFISSGITKKLYLQLAKENEGQLNYGYESLIERLEKHKTD